MLIENDIDTALRLSEMLRERGHDTFLAEARYFLEDLKEQGPFDLVITDIFLKDVSGLQIVLGVKGLDPTVKVVAMSGGSQLSLTDDYLDYAKEFGADAVARKPVDNAELDALLGRLAPEADLPAGQFCPLVSRTS